MNALSQSKSSSNRWMLYLGGLALAAIWVVRVPASEAPASTGGGSPATSCKPEVTKVPVVQVMEAPPLQAEKPKITQHSSPAKAEPRPAAEQVSESTAQLTQGSESASGAVWIEAYIGEPERFRDWFTRKGGLILKPNASGGYEAYGDGNPPRAGEPRVFRQENDSRVTALFDKAPIVIFAWPKPLWDRIEAAATSIRKGNESIRVRYHASGNVLNVYRGNEVLVTL